MSNAIATQLSTSLLDKYHLPVSPTWLSHLLSTLTSTGRPLPPPQALLSTAHFRLLASDITTSLNTSNPHTLLPPNISDVNVKETRLQTNIPVQLLDIQDLGVSKWSQVEAIERIERGEEVRGREVIRTIRGATDDDDGHDATATASTKKSQGPHKLVLQDANQSLVTGFELVAIPKLFIGDDGMCIGGKIILKAGTKVRRGMVMFTPDTVVLLGGKIGSWDTKWREDRKKRLTEDVQREQQLRRNER